MDRQTQIEHLLERMRCFYVAKTGLGRLKDYKTDTAIAPNGVESVNNENGILYRMLAVIQVVRAGAELSLGDRTILALALRTLRRFPNDPAITNRQPHGDVVPRRSEAHDNALGLLLAEWYLEINETAPALIRHWWRNWFCIDNINPGRFSWAQFRQPGEVALYYIAAGRRAPFLFTIWMLIGMLLNTRDEVNKEASRLTFMRHFLIEKKGIKGFVQRWLYGKVKSYWFSRLVEKFGGNGISPMMKEYGDGHPVWDFEKLVDYSGT
jgi:hypothetical protein